MHTHIWLLFQFQQSEEYWKKGVVKIWCCLVTFALPAIQPLYLIIICFQWLKTNIILLMVLITLDFSQVSRKWNIFFPSPVTLIFCHWNSGEKWQASILQFCQCYDHAVEWFSWLKESNSCFRILYNYLHVKCNNPSAHKHRPPKLIWDDTLYKCFLDKDKYYGGCINYPIVFDYVDSIRSVVSMNKSIHLKHSFIVKRW